MRELIEAMENMRGKEVDIYTKHKLFGKQHIKMNFAPEYKVGFGFHCNGQVIYIRDDELVDYYVGNNEIIINGNQMSILIKNKS